ncbi:P-loop containing nucleoside triphosphate hydrolase protein, partial [Baffinella frigidus]
MWKPGTKGPGHIERTSDEKTDVVVNKMQHLPLTTQRQRLPIYCNRSHILYLLENYRTLVIIPQYLYEAGWADGGRMVGCTQPRRVAAQTVAARVAEEMGVQLGKECGYTIRFDNTTDPARTRVKFMTDGILLREMMGDPLLSRYSVVMFMTDGILLREMMGDPLLSRYSVVMVDEAHERGVYSDVLVGLLKKIQRRRKDLRIIISSATLDAEAFRSFFQGDKPEGPPAPGALGRVTVMSMEAGRIFPVNIHYLPTPASDYVRACVATVLSIHATEPAGDVLVFVTGADEVSSICQALHDGAGRGTQGLSLTATPLYAALPLERQLEAFADAPPGTRKVVVATNIAETSITIPGIVYVVDSMFVKMRNYNAKSGVDFLTAYRLCQEVTFDTLREATVPEMQRTDLASVVLQLKRTDLASVVLQLKRTDLASVVLQLKALGIDDILHFDFPSPPPALTLARALEILYALGALDDDAKLTEPL